MPMLDNQKQEAFAIGVAQGNTAKQSALEAGYQREKTASDLLQKPHVQARIRELRLVGSKVSDVSVGWCMDQMKQIIIGAQDDGKWKDAADGVWRMYQMVRESHDDPEIEAFGEPLANKRLMARLGGDDDDEDGPVVDDGGGDLGGTALGVLDLPVESPDAGEGDGVLSGDPRGGALSGLRDHGGEEERPGEDEV